MQLRLNANELTLDRKWLYAPLPANSKAIMCAVAFSTPFHHINLFILATERGGFSPRAAVSRLQQRDFAELLSDLEETRVSLFMQIRQLWMFDETIVYFVRMSKQNVNINVNVQISAESPSAFRSFAKPGRIP